MKESNIVKNRGGFNLLPLIILVGLFYLFFAYDIESVVKNKQLNDNVVYIKSKINSMLDKYSSEIKTGFLKTEGVNNTNKTDTFNLNNFFPELSNLSNVNTETNADNSTDPVKSKSRNGRPEGFEEYGALR